MGVKENLKRLREGAGLSQAELAKRTGLSLRTIQNWEMGRNTPRVAAVVKLAAALGVAVDQLVSDGPHAERSKGKTTGGEGKKPKRKRGS